MTFSVSAILSDLLRSSIVKPDAEDQEEEGQLTQQTDKTLPESILCNAAFILRTTGESESIVGPHLLQAAGGSPGARLPSSASDCRGPRVPDRAHARVGLEARDTLQSALCEEWPVDEISACHSKSRVRCLTSQKHWSSAIDDEVLATLRKAQMSTAYDYAIHVMVAPSEGLSEEQLAGIEVVSLNEFGHDKCQELATLPGN